MTRLRRIEADENRRPQPTNQLGNKGRGPTGNFTSLTVSCPSRCLRYSFSLGRAGVFIFFTLTLSSDVQIVNEIMLEDINNILNAGDVPNLYAPEDLDAIMSSCR